MMAQSNAERYNVIVRIRIGCQIIELPTAQSLRPSVRYLSTSLYTREA